MLKKGVLISKEINMGFRENVWPKLKQMKQKQRGNGGGCTPNGLKRTEKGKVQNVLHASVLGLKRFGSIWI